ncbi:sigma-70 family RNA polymerase sigma factor [Streptomyces sp. HUAS 31]|uniref:sigma-70 family RNA polymerase sigma factor n=1 Tax=Streptomyces sp. HUAS 31 TaxID=3020055 RepID=UPI002306BF4B|nr:sigma-70 family RNA polymerase sigma factor [Streptomyces sp. HUAS 31]WCD94204.1 sigma-70 family RNA polymerase sigma factor [Streptomyces sp. HUAS 31]
MRTMDVRRERREAPSGSVGTSGSAPAARIANGRGQLDPESAAWVDALGDGCGVQYEQACTRLHELLVRIAMDEVFRRGSRYRISGPELDDLAHQAAADALMRITQKIHEFRGDARFTTWAYRFVVLEVSSKLSRHFWRVSHARFDLEDWAQVPDRAGVDPVSYWQARELVEAVRNAVATALSAHQREVFVAVVNGVPLETLANELETNRNALYKTMFDARRKLRAQLIADGHLSTAE